MAFGDREHARIPVVCPGRGVLFFTLVSAQLGAKFMVARMPRFAWLPLRLCWWPAAGASLDVLAPPQQRNAPHLILSPPSVVGRPAGASSGGAPAPIAGLPSP